MNGTEPVRAALWARVSTSDQKTANQVDVLRQWAERRGLDIAAEFITEDSAWQNGNGTKGKEFDRTRDELINGARLGNYTVVLVWAVDRLSRRGIEDTLATMRRLYEHGCDIWSHEEPWLVTSEPRMRELLVSFMAWMAEQESARRSERIKAGMARRRREGQPVGGRVKGARDRKKRSGEGYSAAWAPGGALRVAREAQIAAKRAAQENGSGEDQQ
jgi:putative DNA-invertase from lambdoid prophage Rac